MNYDTAEALLYTLVMDWNDRISKSPYTTCQQAVLKRHNTDSQAPLQKQSSNHSTTSHDNDEVLSQEELDITENVKLLEQTAELLKDTHLGADSSILLTLSDYDASFLHQNSEVMASNFLDDILKRYNVVQVSMPQDGNCFYHSILYSLNSQHSKLEKPFVEHLFSLGLNVFVRHDSQSIRNLRKAVIDQIEKHPDLYQDFVGELNRDTFIDRCRQFRDSGIYGGDIGDVIPKVASDVLCLQLVVIPSSGTEAPKPSSL